MWRFLRNRNWSRAMWMSASLRCSAYIALVNALFYIFFWIALSIFYFTNRTQGLCNRTFCTWKLIWSKIIDNVQSGYKFLNTLRCSVCTQFAHKGMCIQIFCTYISCMFKTVIGSPNINLWKWNCQKIISILCYNKWLHYTYFFRNVI